MSVELSAPPVLSTPAEHVFEHGVAADADQTPPQRTDDELRDLYEVPRTAREVREGGWKRVALQFPDDMLRDGPRVVECLRAELDALPRPEESPAPPERIYILADTSYSACCVDEIAAEHVSADVVVHYGRACLSPTERLPVLYVFTHHTLDHDETLAAFEKEYPDKEARVILMADVTYQSHVPALATELRARGYAHLVSTSIIHDPTGRIPNRKLVTPEGADVDLKDADVQPHAVFHISHPPTALLLALSSRVQTLHIHPTATTTSSSSSFSTARLLGRRYARLLTLASAGVIGILVNTLSVANYRASVDALRRRIAAAGKKSYTVVVGKLNPAKLANFAEVDGWVVVGCWESALVEDDAGYFKPVVTPFELGVALMGDDKRVWSGEWWGGIEGIGDVKAEEEGEEGKDKEGEVPGDDAADGDSEEESAPPEFDLRTGKLVSNSRPMRATQKRAAAGGQAVSTADGKADGKSTAAGALTLRSKGELAMVNGVVSPGAEYLRTQRTWQGLGSDYAGEASTAIEEGRSGVARGYTVGEDGEKR
ncbi:hypothetical protein VTJ83DRAFT_3293 [Remersonia thermophila]|uniref:2-(3-amino-3-carboxypropyl)histidine synthase subunit 2 n=1 Tax=Remersonia thermophila TaxID=72144 RepID=A0ABR4DDQ0_9PEZI